MSLPTNDGGPAFPHILPQEWAEFATGMMMRQWYKGKAMQGLAACGSIHQSIDAANKEVGLSGEAAAKGAAKFMAMMASLLADAMLAEDLEFEKRTAGAS